MTIPQAQIAASNIKKLMLSYDYTIAECEASIQELDKILENCYNQISDFQIAKSPSEIQHLASRLLERCCCIHWRARRIGTGDYCPDCCIHKFQAGTKQGEVRIERPKKRRNSI